jgi:uncharacterized protein (TIGR02391 family)
MPDTVVYGIELLPESEHAWHCPALLDANSAIALLSWLDANPDFSDRLITRKTWRIAALRDHIAALADGPKIVRKLKNYQIELCSSDIVRRERALVAEIQHAYFGDDAAGHDAAELLGYGRRRVGNTQAVRVISAYEPFQHVPRTEVVLLPNLDVLPSKDDRSYRRALESLTLHPKVLEAAGDYLAKRDYPTALNQAINAYYEELRRLGGHAEDGRELVQKALDVNNGKTPSILLNSLGNKTEQSEQRGYYELACGVTAAIRNVLSHGPATSPFIQQRFGERSTALKFLCLLSLLFEKLDKRVAPWP